MWDILSKLHWFHKNFSDSAFQNIDIDLEIGSLLNVQKMGWIW